MDKDLLDLVIMENLSFNLLDSPYLQKWLRKVRPGYLPASSIAKPCQHSC